MTRDPYSILLFQWIAEKGLWKKQSSDTPGRALGLHLLNSAGKTNICIRQLLPWLTGIHLSICYLDNIWYISALLFQAVFVFLLPFPMTIFSSFLNWSTPASLEAGQATKHAGAKTSAAEMQRRRVEQRGARMAVVCWDRPEKKGWEELWSNQKAKKPVLWAGWSKVRGSKVSIPQWISMVCSQ